MQPYRQTKAFGEELRIALNITDFITLSAHACARMAWILESGFCIAAFCDGSGSWLALARLMDIEVGRRRGGGSGIAF